MSIIIDLYDVSVSPDYTQSNDVYWRNPSVTIKIIFIVISVLVHFTTCFGQLGNRQLTHTLYKATGKKLSA